MNRRLDPAALMWAHACELIEQAERMHRQFFRPRAARGARTAWEPPVNVFEDDESYVIMVALPGLSPECVEVLVDSGGLLVRASCEPPFRPRSREIRRLEIPYGYFERRIPLPAGRLEVAANELTHGCLVVRLRKVN